MKAGIAARVSRRLRSIEDAVRPGAAMERNARGLLFHRASSLAASAAITAGVPTQATADSALATRIISAYQRAHAAELGESMWKMFFSEYHRPLHQALLEGNPTTIAAILANPADSDLFYGFDILTRTFAGAFRSKGTRLAYARLCLDGLVRLAESAAALPMDNPETWRAQLATRRDTEGVLNALRVSRPPFSIPNPFPNEHGLASSLGVISYRVPQALYQAWRVQQLVEHVSNPSVLEIGAGLGRTAHYAHELGIKDYTIVDIPITATAQAYFLGRTLGAVNVLLDGEAPTDTSKKLRIISPQTFLSEDKQYDLIVNVDSLPEMDIGVASAYWNKIKGSTSTFLSINHEANAFRVHDLISADSRRLNVHRGLYWMRRGYTEELIRLTPA